MVYFLRKICEKYEDLKFVCQISKGQFSEIQTLIGEFRDRILLKELASNARGINGWYGCAALNGGVRDGVYIINERYDLFFDHLSRQIGIENPINGKNCTLIDHPDIKKDNGVDGFDILLVNSIPRSKQYNYNKEHFRSKISEFKDKYRVITTRPTNLVPCTLDYNLNLLGIGNLSTKVKYVIGIATAPIIPCFNTTNIDTVKKWFVLSKRSSYSYNDRIFRENSVLNIGLEELD